ncbi:helix-turn-helix domain-containing protein [Halomonas vilamensis]|uniref:Helix-turn-helix domain-containing protein n=1 Tax=Vreelandella vilamensis TaxID=531309 RepID=A0ABU1H873_9GAMM|nr:helix-turn-helix domain-containing protein [Halomonas vilamensis]MDR5900325.1 helix-turn-helix domain-containing protein [Halomonas vilamensis]
MYPPLTFQQSPFPMQTPSETPQRDTAAEDARLAKLEQQEPLRRLLRDVAAVKRERGITQAQMATEMEVSPRTLAEWLQGRRYPKGPGQAILRRWLSAYAPGCDT